MKKVSILTVLFLAFAVAQAWATSVPACSAATLDHYLVSGFSCQIGDKIFSNFTYTSSATGEAPILATGVAVDTIGPNPGVPGNGEDIFGIDIGLQFSAGWTATGNQNTDSAIGFVVTVVGGGGFLIKDTGLAQTSGVIAPGHASVTETACGPTPCNPVGGAIKVLTFDGGNGNPLTQTTNNVIFTPIGSIAVSKDINANGGATGFAGISVVQDTFSQTAVPEPASMMLVGGALFGVGLIRRRRSTKA